MNPAVDEKADDAKDKGEAVIGVAHSGIVLHSGISQALGSNRGDATTDIGNGIGASKFLQIRTNYVVEHSLDQDYCFSLRHQNHILFTIMNVPFHVRILIRFGKDFGDEKILNDFTDSLLRRSRRSTERELYKYVV